MNIFLVPYTWARHVSVSLVVGAAAVITWWLVLAWEVVVGPWLGVVWTQSLEGAVLLGFIAGAVGASSVLAEGSLRRSRMRTRIFATIGAGLLSMLLAMAFYGVIQLVHKAIVSEAMRPLLDDPSYVTLRFRLCQWAWAGFASGIGPAFVRLVQTRSFRGAPTHLFGGLAAGAFAAATWHYLGYYGVGWLGIAPDLYLASGMASVVWGVLHGLLVWGIPSELYAGWVRVLSTHRFGHRIPIDALSGRPAERFVGHFPRGLDLFLPADKGVAELHASFVTDGRQTYTVRGLSQQPMLVRRFLERVDLRYDPRRPAPLETELRMEDRIILGQGEQQTELEFILLPKEER